MTAFLPPDFEELHKRIYLSVKDFTMTTPESVHVLIEAVKYIVGNSIPGALVECGVWKGGSAVAMALTLREFGDETRDIYLYDTFAGMSRPTDADLSFRGQSAERIFSKKQISEDASDWCFASLGDVRKNMERSGYPMQRVHFVEGKVEDTIPKIVPQAIALLRLDTDWYESTKHELEHLFPLVSQCGAIIVDDYGYWQGARKAVDEYVDELNAPILLNRIDYTARIAIKVNR